MTKDLFGGFIQKSVANVGKGLERWVESFDPFRFSKRYKEIFLQRCSKIKILGMTRPIDISMIFVDLIPHQDIPSRLYVDHDALDKFFQAPVAQEARVQICMPDGQMYDIKDIKLMENKLFGVRETHRLVLTTYKSKWKMGEVMKKID